VELEPGHPAPPEPNLARNLRILCSSKDSIAEICRRIGISRQQFNKYLSGKHEPSRANLRLICQYFGIDILDLHLAPVRFSALFAKKSFPHLDVLRRSPLATRLLSVAAQSQKDLVGYCGVYERYHPSSIYKGQILRSIVYIYVKDGVVQYSYIERFQNLDDPKKARYIFKYHGVCSFLGGRIFFVDFESVNGNEITYSILIPQQRSSRELLFGLTMGVAASLSREPFAARVALRYCGEGPLSRTFMRRSRTLDPSDGSIPAEVRQYLGVEPILIRGT
jgi:transcriptional regulator with XRE-family HTH domain